MPRRTGKRGLLALPFLILPFTIGWILYFTGMKKYENKPMQRTLPHNRSNVRLGVLLPEKELYAK